MNNDEDLLTNTPAQSAPDPNLAPAVHDGDVEAAIPVNDMLPKQSDSSGNASRQSGIELLKIISIFLVILYHVVQTLTSYPSDIPISDYVLNVSLASTDPALLTLALLRYCGQLGNAIFLICSVWFLLDKATSSKKKIMRMISDIWVISMCVFIPVVIIRHGNVNSTYIYASIFPTIYANNWYMTCYILLSFIYPFLNRLINVMSQRELLGSALFLGLIYLVLNYFFSSLFISGIIVWISVYFVVAYIKKYGAGLQNNAKFAVILLLIGVLGNTLAVMTENLIGLKVPSYSENLIFGDSWCNPFLYMIAFGAFCLFQKAKFHSKFVNGVSSLSMLIYILHENILLRTYYRTMLWHEIFIRFGHKYVLAWVLAMSVAIFVASAVICFIYSKTVQKLTRFTSDKLLAALQKFYRFIEKKVFKIDQFPDEKIPMDSSANSQ